MTIFLLNLDPSFMLLTAAAGVFLDDCAIQDAQHIPGRVQASRTHVKLHTASSVTPAAVVASPALLHPKKLLHTPVCCFFNAGPLHHTGCLQATLTAPDLRAAAFVAHLLLRMAAADTSSFRNMLSCHHRELEQQPTTAGQKNLSVQQPLTVWRLLTLRKAEKIRCNLAACSAVSTHASSP